MQEGRKQNIIALIPARAGSQRVKGKNIRELGGKPLIAYTIDAALKADGIDRVIVSTDSEEIALIAKKYGAEVPFIRPPDISTSESTEFSYHIHALETLFNNESYVADIIVNLYPTTPFRKPDTISRAIKVFKESSTADSLRSVRKCKEHPYKMWQRKGDFLNRFIELEDPAKHTFSYHLLPEVLVQNASIYIVRRETLLKFNNTIGEKVFCFEMNEVESIDINYDLDFDFASFLMSNGKLNQIDII